MSGYWIGYFVSLLLLGLIPAFIAKGKGKDFFTWYVYGVFLFVFAMIHAIVLPEITNEKEKIAKDVMENKTPVREVPVTTIYSDKQIIDPSCPVEVVAYDIKIPEKGESVFVRVKLQNLSHKGIAAVKLVIKCFDSFEEPVGGDGSNVVEKILQDLEVEPGAYFGDSSYIEIDKLKETRKVMVLVKRVLFKDNSRWDYKDDSLVELNTKIIEGRELLNLRNLAGDSAICYAFLSDSHWQCVCGRANTSEANRCIRCNREKEFVLNSCIDRDTVEEELLKIEKEREQEEISRKRAHAERVKQDEINREAAKKKAFKYGLPAAIVLLLIYIINALI